MIQPECSSGRYFGWIIVGCDEIPGTLRAATVRERFSRGQSPLPYSRGSFQYPNEALYARYIDERFRVTIAASRRIMSRSSPNEIFFASVRPLTNLGREGESL